MTKQAILASVFAAALFAGAASAQQAAYTWTGPGVNVRGASKCPGYKMTVNVTVNGNDVKGDFQQEGREQRHFDATLGQGGAFKAVAKLGQGNTIDVAGTIGAGGSKIILDGYCKFEGPLTKKQ
ncbi:MAG: hypothetical protein E6G95_02690 [Alphaproteobacteria bacterium]|nr:MAG: hypothetical protein E6G95_02690 [Alphaproteobacteria bacterium]